MMVKETHGVPFVRYLWSWRLWSCDPGLLLLTLLVQFSLVSLPSLPTCLNVFSTSSLQATQSMSWYSVPTSVGCQQGATLSGVRHVDAGEGRIMQ